MKEKFEKLQNSAFVNVLKYFFNSAYFPFASAAVTLLCYYTGLDTLLICYLGISVVLIFFLLEDVAPVVNVLLYIRICLSPQKNPDYNGVPLTQWGMFIPAIIVGAIAIAALVYRVVKTFRNGKFKPTPMLYGMMAFSAVILLGGLGAKDYSPQNLMFGAFMLLALVGVYAIAKDNIKCDEKTFTQIAYALVAYSVVLVVELAVNYITVDGIIVDGKIVRGAIVFGWGPYTSYGVLAVMTIPAITYLAGKLKYGFLLTAYAVAVAAAVILSCARQGIVALAIVYPISLLLLLIKGKNKFANATVAAALFIACALLLAVYYEYIFDFFKTLFANVIVDGELDGSGRMRLWRQGIENFKNYPVFGIGFYTKTIYPYNSFRFLPYVYHNTIVQMLGACGIIGLVVYLVHRVQTVLCYCKNVTLERTFIVLAASSILITSLLDVHLFGIWLTMVYAFYVAVLEKSLKDSYGTKLFSKNQKKIEDRGV